MGIDYIFIASILFYAFMAQKFSTHDLSVKFTSIITIGVPYVVQKIYKLIFMSGQHIAPLSLFTREDVTLFVVQLLAAFAVFYKLRMSEDTLDSWLMWVAGGAVVIYFVIPFVVERVM